MGDKKTRGTATEDAAGRRAESCHCVPERSSVQPGLAAALYANACVLGDSHKLRVTLVQCGLP